MRPSVEDSPTKPVVITLPSAVEIARPLQQVTASSVMMENIAKPTKILSRQSLAALFYTRR